MNVIPIATALLTTALLPPAGSSRAQQPPAAPAPAPVATAAPQTAPVSAATLPASTWTPPPLEPFVATYQAFYRGKEAGDATMQVSHGEGSQWRIDMSVRGRKGFASILGLNLEQSTVFRVDGDTYVPLSQSTVRKAVFFGKKVTGVYNWQAGTAQWNGDLKEDRQQPIPLQHGDQSALSLNLSLMRDAQPGRSLSYRYVDVGKVRKYDYRAADATEVVQVGDLSYDALRVYRVNSGDNETILWIANGVPTPVRILQRDKGEDQIDLRLVEYQGA
ncbi:DUF3108 domain-containing protein [Xanthomonas phaseoli]|uniref:DUF3108 domain-containing protein n=7 Tax=Xanthomonas TaxID=338 RepID=A0A8I1XGZ5_XANMN|nr:DUF3108 domain-containing protein [Xanthomonas phaseoli]KUF24023.1 hypothetical protein AO826_10975 [Xanthomonas phaseoli pv. manihotis]MBO9720379.1 DUF3108 domain-containing protein [Xanthomonas phaseoli pv. manihotis]MBO9759445.1 DUF3108 domain-containing protein [Xanthomonas phaseoli pv. manihotis]MBO9783072.1 DUF3108 domain-containing protein [Xanthomonas phaseoli pv. manihotis]